MATRRDVARDIVRGLNSLEMSFVNNSAIRWTNHSGYIDQPTYADTIFPCFVFLAGMSRTPLKRSVGLVGLGLALNMIGAHSKGEMTRIPGVLQRLGLASLIFNDSTAGYLLQAYSIPILTLWYVISILFGSENTFAHPAYAGADPSTTAQTKIDTIFFGSRIYTPSYDPEGLLGALTTTVSMLIGREFELGRFSTVQKLLGSLAMIVIGEALHLYLPKYAPISKSLWTPSFVLVTSGLSILKYLIVQSCAPMMPEPLLRTLRCCGQRSLEVYLLSTILEIGLLHGGAASIWERSLSFMSQYMTRTIADFILSTSFTAVMAGAAVFMVTCRIKLSW